MEETCKDGRGGKKKQKNIKYKMTKGVAAVESSKAVL
jgi:hypothetical protein